MSPAARLALLAATAPLACPPACAETDAEQTAAHWRWPDSLEAAAPGAAAPVVLGTAPGEEPCDPAVVGFRDARGLRFSRERRTVARVTDAEPLRVTGALSIAAVIQFSAPVESKSAVVSK